MASLQDRMRRFFLPNVTDDVTLAPTSTLAPGEDLIELEDDVAASPQVDAQDREAMLITPRSVAQHFSSTRPPVGPLTRAGDVVQPQLPDLVSGRPNVSSDITLGEDLIGLKDDATVDAMGSQDDAQITQAPQVKRTTQDETQAHAGTSGGTGVSRDRAPRDPLHVAGWARDVDGDTSQSDLELQAKQNAIDLERTRAKADELVRSAAVEIAANAAAEQRSRESQRLRDASRAELSRRSDVLARAAEQRLTERPGSHDRTVGRALLAIGMGMGSQTAQNLLQASLAEEERRERMDVERRRANIDSLQRSFNAEGDLFDRLGDQMLSDQALEDAQSLAREKLAIKRFEAGVARLLPGETQLQGVAAVNNMKRAYAERELKLADAQVASHLNWLRLNPTVVSGGASGGRRPERPSRPIRKPEMTDEDYRLELEKHYEELKDYESRVLPQWKAKQGQRRTVSGPSAEARSNSPRGRWESSEDVRSSVVTPSRPTVGRPVVGPSTAMLSGPRRTTSQAQRAPNVATGRQPGPTIQDQDVSSAPRPTPAEEAVERDRQARWSIDVPGTRGDDGKPLRISPRVGTNITIDNKTKTETAKQVAEIVSLSNDINRYASLLASDESGKGMFPEIVSYITKDNVDFKTAKQKAANAMRAGLTQRLNTARGMGVLNVGDQPLIEAQLPDMKVYDSDKGGTINTLLETSATLDRELTNGLESYGYDASSLSSDRDDRQRTVRGILIPTKGRNDDVTSRTQKQIEERKVKDYVFTDEGATQLRFSTFASRGKGWTPSKVGKRPSVKVDKRTGDPVANIGDPKVLLPYKVFATEFDRGTQAANDYHKAREADDVEGMRKAQESMREANDGTIKAFEELLRSSNGDRSWIEKRYGLQVGNAMVLPDDVWITEQGDLKGSSSDIMNNDGIRKLMKDTIESNGLIMDRAWLRVSDAIKTSSANAHAVRMKALFDKIEDDRVQAKGKAIKDARDVGRRPGSLSPFLGPPPSSTRFGQSRKGD